jgi:hypothetical protein
MILKRIRLSVLLVFILTLYTLPAFANKAVDTEGRTIILHDDGSWEVEANNITYDVQLPDEKDLYKMIKYDRDDALLELYLEKYEGVDLKNTISVIYHFCFLKPNTEEFDIWRLKGIAYSQQYGKIFMITVGPYENEFVSNLVFYWDFAQSMERQGNIAEALRYYELLRGFVIATEGKYSYNVIDSSLDQLDTKIFKMKLLLSKQ